jgi:hypothetical protein
MRACLPPAHAQGIDVNTTPVEKPVTQNVHLVHRGDRWPRSALAGGLGCDRLLTWPPIQRSSVITQAILASRSVRMTIT